MLKDINFGQLEKCHFLSLWVLITKKVRIPRVGALEYSFCFVTRLRELEQQSSPSPYELLIQCDGEKGWDWSLWVTMRTSPISIFAQASD